MAKIIFKGIDLVQYQKDFLYCKERFSIVDASTKAGKTQPHILWILQLSCNKDPNWNWDTVQGKNFWWVAPVSSQANIAFRRLEDIVRQAPGFKIYRSKGEERIVTPLGSIIWFKSADKPDSLYGEDVYGFVLDEHSRCRIEAWTALYSTMTATKGPGKLIGNYKGGANWSSQLKREKESDPEWYTATITALDAVDAGILDIEIVNQAQKDLPKADFDALYMCMGSIDQYKLFDSDAIDNFYYNDHVIAVNHDTMYLCADIAYLGADFFRIDIWRGNILIKKFKFEKTGGSEIVEHIKRLSIEYGVLRSNIVVDATGADWLSSSDGESGYLEGVKMFKGGEKADEPETYYNQRAEKYYKLATALRQGKLYCQDEEDKELIKEELEAQRRKDSPRGRIQLERKDLIKGILGGRSPDGADNISMRMCFPIEASFEHEEEQQIFTVSF